jgi:hypothetical protein
MGAPSSDRASASRRSLLLPLDAVLLRRPMNRLLVILGLLSGCAEQWPDHVELMPAAAEVDFAEEPPSTDGYKMVGQVTGTAAAHDPDAAEEAARNDMRNKAAALGATVVTIDQNKGEALPLQDKTKVELVGRAYRAVD